MSPYPWINAIFDAKAAKTGGIVRRKIESVKRYASPRFLVLEVERRGFHILEVGDQYLIVCNKGNFRLVR